MTESDIVDITGYGELPNAMDVDVQSPGAEHVATAAALATAGVGSPRGAPGSGHRQHELRYSQRQKRPARHKEMMDVLSDMPQHMSSAWNRSGKNQITLQAMQAHLDSIYIGFRPGDHTAANDLPDELPPPIHPLSDDVVEVNLNECTQEEINEMAELTAPPNQWSALLEVPPGAPMSRLGHFSGQDRVGIRARDPRKQAGDGSAEEPIDLT